MALLVKYVVSVDSSTGQVVKVERIGESGELTEVSGATPQFGSAAFPFQAAVVFNVFVGGAAPGVHPQQPLAASVIPSPGSAVIPSPGVPPEKPKT